VFWEDTVKQAERPHKPQAERKAGGDPQAAHEDFQGSVRHSAEEQEKRITPFQLQPVPYVQISGAVLQAVPASSEQDSGRG
jgi:hypothetical protein